MWRDADGLSAVFITTGVVFRQSGWHVTPYIRRHGGRRSLDVAFTLVLQVLHINDAVAVRACRSVVTMFALIDPAPFQ